MHNSTRYRRGWDSLGHCTVLNVDGQKTGFSYVSHRRYRQKLALLLQECWLFCFLHKPLIVYILPLYRWTGFLTEIIRMALYDELGRKTWRSVSSTLLFGVSLLFASCYVLRMIVFGRCHNNKNENKPNHLLTLVLFDRCYMFRFTLDTIFRLSH